MIRSFLSRLRRRCADIYPWGDVTPPPSSVAIAQKTLAAMYRQQYLAGHASPNFAETGFRVHSQHEEDGLLLFIFSLVGTTSRRCVEFSAGNGVECNTANLIINHRWIGLLCDGSAANVESARRFYARHPDTRYAPPVIVRHWLTRTNVNGLLQSQGFTGEIDLLSLDVDGIDYWLWEAIECVSPRVVVLEFNHLWGPEAAVTVPYSDDFVAEFTPHGSDYAGASLQAFVKLGARKGYRLVGTNAIATNAFFLRDDIECRWLQAIDPTACFSHPRAQFGMTHRLPKVRQRDWVEV